MTKIAAKTRRENMELPFLFEDALEGLADALHLVETEPVENDQPNPAAAPLSRRTGIAEVSPLSGGHDRD